MKTSAATGTVVIVSEHNLETGEITNIRIQANRDDQEAVGRAIVQRIVKRKRPRRTTKK